MTTRRELISLLGGAAAAWPVAARAQQQPMPVIGLLRATAASDSQRLLAAFRAGLGALQFFENQNVKIEYRWAEGRYDRLTALIADLLDKRVALLVAGGNPAALAAKTANLTLPVLFAIGGDPQKLELVDSLARPGRNYTGVSFFAPQLETKRIGLVHELLPKGTSIAILVNPQNPPAPTQIAESEEAARRLRLRLDVLTASNAHDIEAAFPTIVQKGSDALVVAADPFFLSQRERLVELAARYRIPTIYEGRNVVEIGGLMSYGTSLTEAYRHIGAYAGRILKGERPADLPVMQTTMFEFVLNLKTAKSLGLEVPPMLSARADEVIE